MERILEFAGATAPPQPLTWGQYAIWAAIARTAPNDHYFNLRRHLTPPARCRPLGVDAALAALGRVLAHHPTLRGRVETVAGEPIQVIDAHGRVPVPVVAATAEDAEDAAVHLSHALTATRFDYAHEPPVRPGLVTVDGAVVRIVLGFNHLATDGFGADLAIRDLRLALLGRTPPPAGDSLALGAEQRAASGRQRSAEVVEFWARSYRALPPTMLGTERAEPEPVRWRVGRLRSPALALAAGTLAHRYRVSVSTVLLAATAALVAADSGQPHAAILTIVNNRFTPAQQSLVSTLSQEGLFVLDTSTANEFGKLLTPAWRSALRAYRVGQYDQAALDDALSRVSAERGELIHPQCCFNDMRPADRTPAAAADWTQVREALSRTEFSWAPSQAKVSCRLCAHVTAEGPALTYQLTGDTRYLPAARIEAYLRALEWLVVTATDRPVPLAELPALLAGVPA